MSTLIACWFTESNRTFASTFIENVDKLTLKYTWTVQKSLDNARLQLSCAIHTSGFKTLALSLIVLAFLTIIQPRKCGWVSNTEVCQNSLNCGYYFIIGTQQWSWWCPHWVSLCHLSLCQNITHEQKTIKEPSFGMFFWSWVMCTNWEIANRTQ